jgi:hypothetical protein
VAADGLRFASLGPDGAAVARDLRSGELVSRLADEREPLRCLAMFPDGRTLAAGTSVGTVCLWELGPAVPPPAPVTVLNNRALAQLWDDLFELDAAKAYGALRRLAASPDSALPFLVRQLREPQRRTLEERMAKLIVELDDDTFAVRTRAARELAKLGPLAETQLRDALKIAESPEARQQMRRLLDRLTDLRARPIVVPTVVRWLRVVQALEMIGTAEARGCLERIAKQAVSAPERRAAQAAIDRLDRRSAPAIPAEQPR